MSLASVTVDAQLWTNPEVDVVELEGEPGVVKVERADVNEVVVHLCHTGDDQATFSGYLSRAGAIALAISLLTVAEPD